MKYRAIYILILLSNLLAAQKHDYNWLFGYPPTSPGFGNSLMDFNHSPPLVSSVELDVPFQSCGGSLSDSLGSLLFYTNGIRIYNFLNEVIEWGDTINPGQTWNSQQNYGYISAIPPFALPKPSSGNVYYLFHVDFVPANGTAHAEHLYYSIVDMEANNGAGKVLQKNVVLLEGDIMFPAAVKHGNGRDWWVMGLQNGDTKHYLFLLSAQGISGPFVQDIGPPFADAEYAGKSLFSQDGSMYLRHDSNAALRLYDFDRCTGLLSNLRIIPQLGDLHTWNASFSPDDRFLYLNRPGWVKTLDLHATDISATFDTLTNWELNFCPYYPWSSHYFTGQLGPDGMLYYATFSGSTRCLNVVHRPNLPGDAADCEEAGLELPGFNSLTLNQFPNYRLGEMNASPCDTLNFQEPGDGFVATQYLPPTNGLSKNAYTLLTPLPGNRCEGCSPEETKFLNNPQRCVQALLEYQRTGKVQTPWLVKQFEREGILMAPQTVKQ